MSAFYHESGVPSFLAGAPAFSFFEYSIQGYLVNLDRFEYQGDGWFRYKAGQHQFHAPGWYDGYDDEDVARTPVMARTFGLRW